MGTLFSVQFCCEPTTALKNKVYFKKTLKSVPVFLTVMWLFTLDTILAFLFSLSCSCLLLRLIKCKGKKGKSITHDSFYPKVAGIFLFFSFLLIVFMYYLQIAYFTQLMSSINYNLWTFLALEIVLQIVVSSLSS